MQTLANYEITLLTSIIMIIIQIALPICKKEGSPSK